MIDLNTLLAQALETAVKNAVTAATVPLLDRIEVLENLLSEQNFAGAVRDIVQAEFESTDFNTLIDVDSGSIDFTSTFESNDFEEAVRSVIRNSL